MGLSEYWSRALLRASLGIEALPAVGDAHLALLSAEPARASTGAELPELDYPGYTRTLIPVDGWTELDPYEYVNTAPLPLPPNGGAVPQVAWAFAVCDAEQAGNVLWAGRVPGYQLTPGDPDPQIAAGALHLVLPATV